MHNNGAAAVSPGPRETPTIGHDQGKLTRYSYAISMHPSLLCLGRGGLPSRSTSHGSTNNGERQDGTGSKIQNQRGSSESRQTSSHIEQSNKEDKRERYLPSPTETESRKQSEVANLDSKVHSSKSNLEDERNAVLSTDLLSMDFHINLPLSARQGQVQANSKLDRLQQRPQHSSVRKFSSQHTDRVELDSEQQQKVRDCLCVMESFLDQEFDIDAILKQVVVVDCAGTSGESTGKDMMPGCHCESPPREGGIYIVDDGKLDVIANHDEDMVVNTLKPGDYYGELSALFQVSYHTKIKAHDR